MDSKSANEPKHSLENYEYAINRDKFIAEVSLFMFFQQSETIK